jgi:anti-sigma regulatory factor (Ser/Thr protein kinase)
LPRDPRAAGRARRELEELCAGAFTPDDLDRARLLVSELVNNAVLHGSGQITLTAGLDDDRLLVEVIDEGTGFERVVRERELEQLGGWGLNIVDSESSRWGIHEGTTHVWFEIERPGPRLGVEQKPAVADGD